MTGFKACWTDGWTDDWAARTEFEQSWLWIPFVMLSFLVLPYVAIILAEALEPVCYA
jgi:hypothetical protein